MASVSSPGVHQGVLVVHGVEEVGDIPRLAEFAEDYELRFATDRDTLQQVLPGADILLEWNFAAEDLQQAWSRADRLRWIHWSGAGVDAALFPGACASDVVLTNARGVFDRAMAEYVLGLVCAFAKRLPETLALQRENTWQHRLTRRIEGQVATLVGIGGIGRATSRLLRLIGMRTIGVGRHSRTVDLDFDQVYSIRDLNQALGQSDFLILSLPATAETEQIIDANALNALKRGAYVINVGRGHSLHEEALINALISERVAGAALDVFVNEPLARDHPLWSMDNVIISPHMSGDYIGFAVALAEVFLDNLHRYQMGWPLLNQIDKTQGYFVSSLTRSTI